jgi:hypothetical protein
MADDVDIADDWVHRFPVVALSRRNRSWDLANCWSATRGSSEGRSVMAEFAWDAGIVTLLASVALFVGAGIVAIASSR